MKKYIFFHIFTDGPYENVVREMMCQCADSGIMEDVEQVFYCIVGDEYERVQAIMSQFPKTTMLKWGGHRSAKMFERLTLYEMRNFACNLGRDNAHFLYMHSKGVSARSRNRPTVHLWRKVMLDILLMYRETCWTKLESECSAVGMFFFANPAWHFSGNFWWTTSDYIKTLPMPIGGGYLEPEMWIGKCLKWGVSLLQHHFVFYNACPDIAYCRGHLKTHNVGNMSSLGTDCIDWASVRTVECGFNQTWFPCTIPSPIQGTIILNLDNFPIIGQTDPYVGIVKQFRVSFHHPDSNPMVFLEGTTIYRDSPYTKIHLDQMTACLYAKKDDHSCHVDVAPILRNKQKRGRNCCLSNDFIGNDPFYGSVKIFIFHFNDNQPHIVMEEDSFVHFV